MTNIRSLGDFVDKRDETNPYSYAGGHNSAIGIEDGGHVIHLYSDGFIVDDGPFRPLSEPENAKFLSDVRKGVAPPEFQNGNNPVDVRVIDHPNKTYIMQRPRFPENPKVTQRDLKHCLGDKNTTLRIKLSTGDMINLTISEEATLKDLRKFIAMQTDNGKGFNLLFGYPPRLINLEETTTLRDADILNCNVLQK